MAWMIVAAGIALVSFYFFFTFNRFIKLRSMRRRAWAVIDDHLKKRHYLIPGIIEEARCYIKEEDEFFSKVTEARLECFKAERIKDKADAENKLIHSLNTLFALAENYPDLKAGRDFVELKKALYDIEDRIHFNRCYFNDVTKNINSLAESFPSFYVAKTFNFRPVVYFELSNLREREMPRAEIK